MKYLLLLCISIYLSAIECSNYKVHSLFYQPLTKDAHIQWKKKFRQMNNQNIDTLILQWSQYGTYNFLDNKEWLNTILDEASQHNIKVIIGLYADENYFKTLKNDTTDIAQYLNTLKTKNLQQANKIFTQAAKYRSFYAWYIYDEINDLYFRSKSKQLLLHNYLADLAKGLKKISQKPLYISSYFSMAMEPNDFAIMLSYLSSQQYTVLLQSGVGAQLVNLRESAIYMQAFYKHYDTPFIPIVESFKIVDTKTLAISQKSRCKQMKMLEKSTKHKSFSIFSMRYFFDDGLR